MKKKVVGWHYLDRFVLDYYSLDRFLGDFLSLAQRPSEIPLTGLANNRFSLLQTLTHTKMNNTKEIQ